ncbi:ribonuclease H-like domain-containing protein [Dichotomocladium elegans]|nr:ribonuclease H-like domain-containing protein [Dichotomocladium elegans]
MASIPHVELTSENVDEHERGLIEKLEQARHVAIDLEFTGHNRTFPKNMEQRYEELSAVIQSNAVVSLGLTIIQPDSSFDTYDLLLFNEAVHQVHPSNLRFLAQNGFNFNRQYRCGLLYRPGDCNTDDVKYKHLLARKLWIKIHRVLFNKKIPLVVHNGLMDLMYLYQSFIGALPSKLQTFVEDMFDAFPGGIYDTKYLSLYVFNENVTFLAYLFCKYERLHRNKRALAIDSDADISAKRQRVVGGELSNNNLIPKAEEEANDKMLKQQQEEICNNYATRGYCQDGVNCKRSHNLERILDRDLKVSAPSTDPIPVRSDHSAYYDAYMTGFIFNRMREQLGEDSLTEHINKLNLMRLDIPLRITSSVYAKPSRNWLDTKKRLQYEHAQAPETQSS